MDLRLVAAIVIGSLAAGCLEGESGLDTPQTVDAAPATLSERTVLYVNGTIPISAYACAAAGCAGDWPLQEWRLELTNTTVTRLNYQLAWNDSPPICQHLRLLIAYDEETPSSINTRHLVFANGASPLVGQFEDQPLPLNETLSLSTVVGVRNNPSGSPVTLFFGAPIAYSLRIDLEHREMLPQDGDWLQDPEDGSQQPLPAPYLPVCA